MSALSYLLHWWILVTLVAPPPHTAKCVEKMQVLLTSVGNHLVLLFLHVLKPQALVTVLGLV